MARYFSKKSPEEVNNYYLEAQEIIKDVIEEGVDDLLSLTEKYGFRIASDFFKDLVVYRVLLRGKEKKIPEIILRIALGFSPGTGGISLKYLRLQIKKFLPEVDL